MLTLLNQGFRSILQFFRTMTDWDFCINCNATAQWAIRPVAKIFIHELVLEGELSEKSNESGITRGTVFGPIIFLCKVNDLLNSENVWRCYITKLTKNYISNALIKIILDLDPGLHLWPKNHELYNRSSLAQMTIKRVVYHTSLVLLVFLSLL